MAVVVVIVGSGGGDSSGNSEEGGCGSGGGGGGDGERAFLCSHSLYMWKLELHKIEMQRSRCDVLTQRFRLLGQK